VCLNISLHDSDVPNATPNQVVKVTCAVVPYLYDEFILTADVIRRLSRCDLLVSQTHVNDVNGAVVSPAEDNRDDVAVSSSAVVDDHVTVVNDQNDADCSNVTDGGRMPTSNCSLIFSSEVAQEQRDDPSLTGCWKLAEKGRAGFVVKDNLLYQRTKILGQYVYQLAMPESCRAHVLKMGHGSFGWHIGFKRTKARICYTFYWPGLREDCLRYVQTCVACHMKARVTCRDRVPIKPIQRADRVFDHWFIDFHY